MAGGVQQCVDRMASQPGYEECAKVLRTLLGNLVREPTNEKYRRIRVTNPTLQRTVFSVDGAYDLLRALGWEDEGEHLVISVPDLSLTQIVLDLLPAAPAPAPPPPPSAVAEERRREVERKLAAERAEKDRLLAAARDDRANRANRRATSSTATELPERRGGNITRYSDLGVDLNRGGG